MRETREEYWDNLKNLGMFESATLRLTAWYMLIIMALSFLFSLALFNIASNEFDHALGPRRPGEMRIFIETDDAVAFRRQRVEDSNGRLVNSLVFLNLAVLVGGGALSYLLAKRTLKPIQEAHEAQSRFASDAAHELRTPLSVMQAEIEVSLRNKSANKKDYQQVLSSSLDEVGRLKSLTDRLLLLASQHKMQLESVDVEDVAVEALTHLVPLAQARGISIDNQVGTAKVLANRESLIDVLTIFLDNAVKYSPKHSRVTIQSKVTDRWVSLSVIDKGPGVSPADQERIFERFYRTDLSRSKENVDGHGLGLSLAKIFVEEMGGGITVKSEVGQGSTFTVKLPVIS